MARPWSPAGVAVFDALHRRHKVTDAMLYAFDLLELNGEDLRPLPLADRKAKLAKLLARSRTGIVFNEHTDQDGATVFRHACKMGLEGIVSKRLAAPYRSGASRDWIKVKIPDSPAMVRFREGWWEK
jgi:bifunctional non-homologous end joining protein LigD